MRSFSRPQTKSSPSLRNPRSPVRRYEYTLSESPAIELSNTCSESSGLFQYPWHLLRPATHISPIPPLPTSTPVPGSTIRTWIPSSGLPQLTSSTCWSGGVSAAAITTARVCSKPRSILTDRCPELLTANVFSASPYATTCAAGRSPYFANRSRKSRYVLGLTGSAAFMKTCTELRSRPSSTSSGTRLLERQYSKPKFGDDV